MVVVLTPIQLVSSTTKVGYPHTTSFVFDTILCDKVCQGFVGCLSVVFFRS